MIGVAGVREKLRAIVAAVPDSGQVHDYMRVPQLEAELQALLVSGGKLQAWLISLADENPYLTTRRPANHELSTYRFALRRYLAVSDADASEKAHALHVEAVIAAFRANKKLDNTVIEAGPAQWTDSNHREFAGVLCHYAELQVAVLEQTEP